jgi:hypothetical protein
MWVSETGKICFPIFTNKKSLFKSVNMCDFNRHDISTNQLTHFFCRASQIGNGNLLEKNTQLGDEKQFDEKTPKTR